MAFNDKVTKTAQQYDMGKARVELLGGEQGRELIVGGFPVWPKKEDLQKWVADYLQPAFPADIREQIETVQYPGKRLSLVVVVMRNVGTPKENRNLMFKAIKAFNSNKPTFQARGTEHTLWAGPSKPQHIRQEDNIVSEALLASRTPGVPRLDFREEVLKGTIPGYTPEMLAAAKAEVQKARAEKRAKA